MGTGMRRERRGKPSRPSANLTCVGFCAVLKASNTLIRFERTRIARKAPRPRPTREPIVAWVDSFPAADLRVVRSDSVRLVELV